MRRFVGILSMLMLAHLSLGVGDLACAPHDGAMDHGEQQHAGMAMGGSHRPDAGQTAPACDTSGQQCPASSSTPECCTAMASCAVFVSCGAAASFVAIQETSPPFGDLLTASSGARRPETPPPRS